ncbi:McrB family protein [Phaeovulum veldkampii]|uniref:McrB family protein n=1 Tax=Phaeovulum veldkampii TaxID=33049 RepID=UPI0010D267E9|nr:AAA family ATPase [Phaeovulum veldkampii]TDQ54497.1 dynein-related subfamily AAA family protein [Phaeovulum veldkampii DSM 11550]
MKQDEFRKWLVAQGQTDATASSRVSSAKRVEQYLGDLDELFAQEDRDSILNRFAYTAEDERADRPNPSPVPIDGVLRTGLASLQQALKLYHSFLTEQSNVPDKAEHKALVDRLTRKEIDAAMRECDRLGLKAFLARGGFASPQVWVSDEGKGQSYPAKATVAAALGHLPDGRALAAKEFFNGFGEAQSFAKLEALGYEILRKGANGGDDAFSRDRIEGAMDAYDQFRTSGAHADAFSSFGTPSEYWVRSTRPRQDRRFPTKPIVGYLLAKASNALTGGWSQPNDAAARLHAAGYIIVDQDDVPLPLPEQYTHLMRGADRVRLVALNYYIAPAREADMSSVAIRARDVARDISEQDAFPTICSALGGKKFKDMAGYSTLQSTTPNPSSTTTFTFTLDTGDKEGNAMADLETRSQDQLAWTAVKTTNLILYGPPGTGKTYQTAWEAVRLCLGEDAAAGLSGEKNRDRLMGEYRRLTSKGRIEFVTFHQSMSYEEFVEGLRPAVDGEAPSENSAGFRLEPVAGIFQRVARRAEASAWDGASTGQDADEAMPDAPELDVAVSVPPETDSLDNRDRQPQQGLENDLFTVGQLPPVRDGTFRKLAQNVAQELAQAHPQGFSLQQYREALVSAGRETGIEPTGGWEKHNMPTWASHPDQAWLVPADAAVAASSNPRTNGGQQTSGVSVRVEHNTSAAHVLIIDEINRANISKVFGELITLLEPDKRLGRRDEIQLSLPYSKKRFGVPPNLHIIGTMNTADRSIALLDTALRRRFTFKELMPNPAVLSPNVGGINLQKLLTTINDRIEYLFDREHQIGHAYFTGCKSAEEVEDVMRHKVIPLLSEYFYEDWSKVAAVLGDGPQGPSRFLEARRLTAPPGIAADDFSGERLRWRVKDKFDFSEFAA